jgi:hypothetical protein
MDKREKNGTKRQKCAHLHYHATLVFVDDSLHLQEASEPDRVRETIKMTEGVVRELENVNIVLCTFTCSTNCACHVVFDTEMQDS